MTTLLVDGNNVLIRAVKAAEGGRLALSNDEGVPTAALLIFINTLSRHVREERPDRMVVCFDGGRSQYRTMLYPAYKANRAEKTEEDDAHRPFSQVKEFLSLAGIHHVERAGWEADDLIAAYWQAIAPLDDVVILSSDKDLLQLVSPRCTQVRVSSSPPTYRWDAARVLAEIGCHPGQIPELMALTGDPGDNVPGVRGIGPKKGLARLSAHHWDPVAAVADLGQEAQEMAALSRSLVDLRGIHYAAQGLFVGEPPTFVPTNITSALYPDLLAFLDRYQMTSVTNRITSGTLWAPEPEHQEVSFV